MQSRAESGRLCGMASRLLSPSEAAESLGIHVATLRRAMRRGEIESQRTSPNGWHRFTPEEVARYRESLRNGGAT